MKLLRLGVTAAMVLAALSSGIARASETASPRPHLLSVTWTTSPLTAASVETLEIRAVDPDGVITTVNVLWGDGVFDHADLICFQSGEVARVLLTHRYARAGAYRVRVVATSGPRCFSSRQRSPEERVWAFVHPRST
jgi:hypothetical protein